MNCPICQWPLERTIDYLENTITEDTLTCENCKLWSYVYSYGNIMYQIGGELFQMYYNEERDRVMSQVMATEELVRNYCWSCAGPRDWMECMVCAYQSEVWRTL